MFQTTYQGRGRLKAFAMCRKYYWRYFADYKVSLPFCPPHMTDGRVFRRPVIFYRCGTVYPNAAINSCACL
ncbi:hypothetical protein NL453_27890, partial [Klebsiella pneumoniae]|nr:hypothetical protein [Klebsiella pneumoniae]